MNFIKKGGFLLLIAMIAWCSSSAPELSFEETIQVYQNQSSLLKDFLTFVKDAEKQVKTSMDLSTTYQLNEESVWGSVNLSVESVSDNKTHDIEADVKLVYNVNNNKDTEEVGINWINIDFKTLVKDFIIYININDVNVSSDTPELATMVTEMIKGYTNKWIKIGTEEVSEILKSSEKDSSLENLARDISNYVKNEKSTKYWEYPAWKVDLDIDAIKQDFMKIYNQEKEESLKIYDDEDELALKNETYEEFEKNLEDLTVENVEAYFVIHSSKEVVFVIENADIVAQGIKVNIQESLNWGKTNWIITLKWEEDQAIKAIVNWEKKLTSYAVDGALIKGENEELLKFEGTIKGSLNDKQIELTPKFVISNDEFNITLDGSVNSEKMQDHVFVAPDESIELEEIVGSLLWSSNYELDYDEIENEDEEYFNEEDKNTWEDDATEDYEE